MVAHSEGALSKVLEASQVCVSYESSISKALRSYQATVNGFVEAGYRSVTTLTFVAPEVTIPQIIQQIQYDINAQEIEALSDEDLAIWGTPEGTTYIDGRFVYLLEQCQR